MVYQEKIAPPGPLPAPAQRTCRCSFVPAPNRIYRARELMAERAPRAHSSEE